MSSTPKAGDDKLANGATGRGAVGQSRVDRVDTDGRVDDEAEGFLGRWSSRKRRVREAGRDSEFGQSTVGESTMVESRPTTLGLDAGESEPTADARFHVDTAVQVHSAETPVEQAPGQPGDATGNAPASSETKATDDERLLSDEDMPALDTLTSDSDMSPFFNRGVTAAVRRAALRHVFSLPVYNVRDGLNDYDGDYTVFEPLGDTITADMKYHAARHERDRLAREAEEAAEQEQRVNADAAAKDASRSQEESTAAEPDAPEEHDAESESEEDQLSRELAARDEDDMDASSEANGAGKQISDVETPTGSGV